MDSVQVVRGEAGLVEDAAQRLGLDDDAGVARGLVLPASGWLPGTTARPAS